MVESFERKVQVLVGKGDSTHRKQKSQEGSWRKWANTEHNHLITVSWNKEDLKLHVERIYHVSENTWTAQ